MEIILGLLGGVTSILTSWWTAFLLVLPVLAAVFGEFFKPIAKSFGDLLAWLVDTLKVGIQTIFGVWQAIVTVILLCTTVWAATSLGHLGSVKECPDVAPYIREEYKLIPRTSQEKKDYLSRQGQSKPWWNRSWF